MDEVAVLIAEALHRVQIEAPKRQKELALLPVSLLIICPGLALVGEVALAYWKAGAPTEVLLLYVVSHVVGVTLIFLKSALSLLELLCDWFAETVLPNSTFFDPRLQKRLPLILGPRNASRPF